MKATKQRAERRVDRQAIEALLDGGDHVAQDADLGVPQVLPPLSHLDGHLPNSP
jgi:hypothetical protein